MNKDLVLLVDDEKTLVKALTFNLEKEGFKVEQAYDGEEALQKVFTLAPDIVVLDLMLPGLDGFEVCRRIRKKLDVPIIMLTARSEDIDKVLGLELIQIGDLQVDLLQHRVRLREQEISLTSKEFALLSFLVANAGNVYSREQLLEQVWGYDYYGDVRTVDVHIRHLREKLERDPGSPDYILTVWGTGYKIREDL